MFVYVMLAVAASLCFALQFVFNKEYQRRIEATFFSSNNFQIICAVMKSVILVAIILVTGSGFKFEMYSVLMALGLCVIAVIISFLGMLTLKLGNVGTYSVFMMMGGMAVPFFMGVLFLNEEFTLLKGIAMLIMAVSIVLPLKDNQKEKNGEKKPWSAVAVYTLLCISLFFLIGGYSVISKLHPMGEEWGYKISDTYNFTLISTLFTVFYGIIMWCIVLPLRKKTDAEKYNAEIVVLKETLKPSNLLITAGFSVFSLAGFIIQLICADKLSASVLFPITSGGTMLFSALFGRIIYKEKISPLMAVSLLLTLTATVIFALQ